MPNWTLGTNVDRYRIDAEIGGGSMGDVYRGLDVDLDRPVALKILSERHRDNDELRARFVREGRAVAKISHPSVVQVFATGTYDGRPYIAMEFLRGVDLGSAVDESGAWDALRAARAVLDAVRGLEAATEAGLIHRDVKPSNLVLLESGVVKVTDFGLAKPLDPSSEPALTALGVVVGTPDYIAPEQARGDPIDQRVDIYALGGTLYYLLTGSPPFRTGVPSEDRYLKVVARHLKNPVPSAHEHDPRADRELSELARTMMAKAPYLRPGYAEIAERLAAVIDRLKASGQPEPSPMPMPAEDGRAGRAAPTPFIGGAAPAGAPEPDAGDTDREPAATSRLAVQGGPPAGDPAPKDAADTLVRPPPPAPGASRSGSASLLVRGTRTSKWLAALTIVAVVVFLAGLAVTLFDPLGARRTAPAGRAAPAAGPADAGAPGSGG